MTKSSESVGKGAHGGLAGKRVVITRPRERAAAWSEAFEGAGAVVIACPVIELAPVSGAARATAVERLTALATADRCWLAFTSVPGVERTLDLLEAEGLTERAKEIVHVGSVGPLTTHALESAGWQVDAEPEESNAGALARQILVRDPKPRVVHPTSNRGRIELSREIERAGGDCDTVVVYENSPRTDFTADELRALSGGSDLLTFASPTAVEAAWAAVPAEARSSLLATAAVVVGETTAEAARAVGFTNVLVAARPRVDEVVRAAESA